MSEGRFQYCKSFFSDRYQVAKSQVTNFLDSKPVKQTAQTLTKQLNKCTAVVSEQYQEAKAQLTKVVQSQSVIPVIEVVDEKIEKIVNQPAQSRLELNETVNQAKQQLAELIESDSFLQARSVIEGAVKTTLGVNYIFDLGLKLLPFAGPAYTTLEALKYAAAGFALVVASYKTYDDLTSQKTIREDLECLEDEINTAQSVLQQANIRNEIKPSGATPTVKVNYAGKLKVTVAEPVNKSECGDVSVSSAHLIAQSFLDAAVKSIGYFYLADMATGITPYQERINRFKHLLLWSIMSVNILSAYLRNESEFKAKLKLSELENKISPTYIQLLELERKLGSKQQLKKIAEKVGMPSEKEWADNMPEYRNEEVRSRISVLSEQDPAAGFGALLNGAALASGIHFIFEKSLPDMVTAKYLAAIATLLATGAASYSQTMDNVKFRKSLNKLVEKNQDIQDIFVLAKSIENHSNKHVFFKEKIADSPNQKDESNLVISKTI